MYLSARYYDPATCQFITKDPAKADGEESAYQYCGGDPVGKVDPSGRWVWLAYHRITEKEVYQRNVMLGGLRFAATIAGGLVAEWFLGATVGGMPLWGKVVSTAYSGVSFYASFWYHAGDLLVFERSTYAYLRRYEPFDSRYYVYHRTRLYSRYPTGRWRVVKTWEGSKQEIRMHFRRASGTGPVYLGWPKWVPAV